MGLKFKRWKLIGIGPYGSCHLYASITAIKDNIGARGIGASIASKVQVDTLQFSWISVPSHRSVSEPSFFHFKRAISPNRSIDVSRTNTVDSCEVDELHGKRLCEVDDSCFASV